MQSYDVFLIPPNLFQKKCRFFFFSSFFCLKRAFEMPQTPFATFSGINFHAVAGMMQTEASGFVAAVICREIACCPIFSVKMHRKKVLYPDGTEKFACSAFEIRTLPRIYRKKNNVQPRILVRYTFQDFSVMHRSNLYLAESRFILPVPVVQVAGMKYLLPSARVTRKLTPSSVDGYAFTDISPGSPSL